jgi:hypothetical protein
LNIGGWSIIRNDTGVEASTNERSCCRDQGKGKHTVV